MSRMSNRIAYGQALVELGGRDERIVVLDADLAKATQTAMFAEAFPKRFFDMGIAEQNMMGTAAGLATVGLIPFVSTFAVFASMRAVEQFRNMIAYPNLNVKVVPTHAGTENGGDGGSHQSVEDIAIMRAIPNVTVLVPSDHISARAAILAAAERKGPVYVRIGRLEFDSIYDSGFAFTVGKGVQLTDGEDVTIAAVGSMVEKALAARELLLGRGITARVIDLLSVKPLDEELLLTAARETRGIITVEDHSIIGGLGGAVAEFLAEHHPTPMRRVGINDRFGETGDPKVLQEYLGLSVENIVQQAEKLLQ